jgi:thiamine-monophosphate kinase
LHGDLPELDATTAGMLIERYRLPAPRVNVGPRLIGLASATIDVSDGLVADLSHICEVSGLGAVVEASRVPLSPAARAAIAGDVSRSEAALAGGDDYEILFTAAPAASGKIDELSRASGLPITAIGQMLEEPSATQERVVVLDAAGQPLELARRGWAHF